MPNPGENSAGFTPSGLADISKGASQKQIQQYSGQTNAAGVSNRDRGGSGIPSGPPPSSLDRLTRSPIPADLGGSIGGSSVLGAFSGSSSAIQQQQKQTQDLSGSFLSDLTARTGVNLNAFKPSPPPLLISGENTDVKHTGPSGYADFFGAVPAQGIASPKKSVSQSALDAAAQRALNTGLNSYGPGYFGNSRTVYGGVAGARAIQNPNTGRLELVNAVPDNTTGPTKPAGAGLPFVSTIGGITSEAAKPTLAGIPLVSSGPSTPSPLFGLPASGAALVIGAAAVDNFNKANPSFASSLNNVINQAISQKGNSGFVAVDFGNGQTKQYALGTSKDAILSDIANQWNANPQAGNIKLSTSYSLVQPRTPAQIAKDVQDISDLKSTIQRQKDAGLDTFEVYSNRQLVGTTSGNRAFHDIIGLRQQYGSIKINASNIKAVQSSLSANAAAIGTIRSANVQNEAQIKSAIADARAAGATSISIVDANGNIVKSVSPQQAFRAIAIAGGFSGVPLSIKYSYAGPAGGSTIHNVGSEPFFASELESQNKQPQGPLETAQYLGSVAERSIASLPNAVINYVTGLGGEKTQTKLESNPGEFYSGLFSVIPAGQQALRQAGYPSSILGPSTETRTPSQIFFGGLESAAKEATTNPLKVVAETPGFLSQAFLFGEGANAATKGVGEVATKVSGKISENIQKGAVSNVEKIAVKALREGQAEYEVTKPLPRSIFSQGTVGKSGNVSPEIKAAEPFLTRIGPVGAGKVSSIIPKLGPGLKEIFGIGQVGTKTTIAKYTGPKLKPVNINDLANDVRLIPNEKGELLPYSDKVDLSKYKFDEKGNILPDFISSPSGKVLGQGTKFLESNAFKVAQAQGKIPNNLSYTDFQNNIVNDAELKSIKSAASKEGRDPNEKFYRFEGSTTKYSVNDALKFNKYYNSFTDFLSSPDFFKGVPEKYSKTLSSESQNFFNEVVKTTKPIFGKVSQGYEARLPNPAGEVQPIIPRAYIDPFGITTIVRSDTSGFLPNKFIAQNISPSLAKELGAKAEPTPNTYSGLFTKENAAILQREMQNKNVIQPFDLFSYATKDIQKNPSLGYLARNPKEYTNPIYGKAVRPGVTGYYEGTYTGSKAGQYTGTLEGGVKTSKPFTPPTGKGNNRPLVGGQFGLGETKTGTVITKNELTPQETNTLDKIFGTSEIVKPIKNPTTGRYDALGYVLTSEQKQQRSRGTQGLEQPYEILAYPPGVVQPQRERLGIFNIPSSRTTTRERTALIPELGTSQKENQLPKLGNIWFPVQSQQTKPSQVVTPQTSNILVQSQTPNQSTQQSNDYLFSTQQEQQPLTGGVLTSEVPFEGNNLLPPPSGVFGQWLQGTSWKFPKKLPPGKRSYILWGTNPDVVGDFYTKGLAEQTVSSSPKIFTQGEKAISKANRGKGLSNFVSFSGNVNVVSPKSKQKQSNSYLGMQPRKPSKKSKSNSIWF